MARSTLLMHVVHLGRLKPPRKAAGQMDLLTVPSRVILVMVQGLALALGWETLRGHPVPHTPAQRVEALDRCAGVTGVVGTARNTRHPPYLTDYV